MRDLTERMQQMAPDVAEREHSARPAELPKSELNKLIETLETEMKAAAKALEFEKAATLRDQIIELRQVMVLKDVEIGEPSLTLVRRSTRRPGR